MNNQTRKALLIEDNPGDARLIQEMLFEAAGTRFDLETVDRLSAGLECLAAGEIDVVLLDLSLPDSEGLDTLERVLSEAKRAPILVLTGLNNEEIGVEALKKGAQDYLVKGQVDSQSLVRAIRYSMERKRTQDAEREQRILAEALSDTASALTNTLDPTVVMTRILDNVGRIVPHKSANIMLVEEAETIYFAYWRGYPAEVQVFLQSQHFSLESLKASDLLDGIRPILIENAGESPVWWQSPEMHWVCSRIIAPLHAYGRLIGFLNLESDSPGAFTNEHVERLEAFADQVAVAVHNAQLYAELRQHATTLEQRVTDRTIELQQTKERVEAILNSSSDAILLIGDTGLIRQCNPAFEQMFGFLSDEVFGLSLSTLIAENHRDRLSETLHTVIESNLPRRVEVLACRRDGTNFDTDVALSPISADRSSAIVCSLRDISERKKLEAGLRRALETERELGELKSRFVSMASHEFRTPLATIQATSDTLNRYWDRMDEQQRSQRFDKVRGQVQHMTTLLDDVLIIGRMESGRVDFNPVALNLADFCREIVDEFRGASGKCHDLIYTPEGNSSLVMLDEKLMRQILSNLLSNAIKYTPKGGEVLVDLVCKTDQTLLRVKDSGIGIPEEDQERLFESFHRAANVGTVSGTGLGLTITKRAVELHGGEISFESKDGLGTTFTVVIPNAQGEDGDV